MEIRFSFINANCDSDSGQFDSILFGTPKISRQYEEHSKPFRFKQDFIDNLHSAATLCSLLKAADGKQHLWHLCVSKTDVCAKYQGGPWFINK